MKILTLLTIAAFGLFASITSNDTAKLETAGGVMQAKAEQHGPQIATKISVTAEQHASNEQVSADSLHIC